MFEELQLALMDIVLPEQLALFLDAQRLLNDIGLTSADEELQTILGLQHGISDDTLFVGRIHDCLVYAVGGALREYGVLLTDDVSLKLMVSVLRSVSQCEHYLIPENIQDILCSGRSNEEIIAALVPLFNDCQESEAVECISEVTDATIIRLSHVIEEECKLQPQETVEVEDRELRLKRINQMLTQTQMFHPQLTVQLSRQGVRMGTPLDILLPTTAESLESLDEEPFAYELLGLVYYSNTPVSDIHSTLMTVAEDLVHELEELTPLKKRLFNLYHEYADVAEINQ